MTSSLTYIPVFKILKILDFIALKQSTFSPKKVFNFRGKNLKILKIRDSYLLELFK